MTMRSLFFCLVASLACFILANTTLSKQTMNNNYSTHSSSNGNGNSSQQQSPSSLEFTVNQTQFFLQTQDQFRRKRKSGSGKHSAESSSSRVVVMLTPPWNRKLSKPLCSRQDVISGQWQATTLPEAPYVSTTSHLRCYPKNYYEQKPFPTYKWKPHNSENCDFTKWRSSLFCKVARYSTVMIVGDSLSWEHYSSLVQLVTGKPIHQGFQHQSKYLKENIAISSCKDANADQEKPTVRLVYRRDDRLLELEDALQQDFPTILVLNRGAHFVNDTTLMREMEPNWILIRKWLHDCKHVHGIRCRLFWRTSVPGHPKCARFKEPVNDLSAMEAWIANRNNYNERSINYHWYDYQSQNDLMLQELEKQLSAENEGSLSSLGILDAYYLNVLRPDEHRWYKNDDCLHNCYPGKMDVYSQMLLHYLRADTTADEIEQRQAFWQRSSSSSLYKKHQRHDSVYKREEWREEYNQKSSFTIPRQKQKKTKG